MNGSDQNKQRLPAHVCAICSKSLEEVGGKRIVGNQLRGVFLSDKPSGGGNPEYPAISKHVDDNPDVYLIIKGEKTKWTDEAIDRAIMIYFNGQHPWMCQVCAERKCSECGAPINYPVGCDVIDENGCISHYPMIPADLGCINPDCKKYRDMTGH